MASGHSGGMDLPRLRARFWPVLAQAEDGARALVLRAKRALGVLRPLRARPFTGHGTASVVHVKGRVRERTGVVAPQPSDGPLDNLRAVVRRFTATPVPDARVLLQLHAASRTPGAPPVGAGGALVVSDRDGYFRAELRPTVRLEAGWHELTAQLQHPVGTGQVQERTAGRVLVPPPDADFGIISDLDDTVIRSDVTRPLRAALTVLLHNARTRTPFQGVAAFYRALQDGPSGTSRNPLFYVSSSPWNLYDLVMSFLELNQVPAGPLFLRAWGLDADTRPGAGHHGHKSELVLGLLDTYPDLRFVLIGDSGQQDPEIYRDVALAHPDRIVAVYVRDVTTAERDASVAAVARQVVAAGVPFELVADSAAAARHAAGLGLVTPAALEQVRGAVVPAGPVA